MGARNLFVNMQYWKAPWDGDIWIKWENEQLDNKGSEHFVGSKDKGNVGKIACVFEKLRGIWGEIWVSGCHLGPSRPGKDPIPWMTQKVTVGFGTRTLHDTIYYLGASYIRDVRESIKHFTCALRVSFRKEPLPWVWSPASERKKKNILVFETVSKLWYIRKRSIHANLKNVQKKTKPRVQWKKKK